MNWEVGSKCEAVGAEMERVKKLVGLWKEPGYGYVERYGEDWEKEVEKVLTKGKHNKV
jgi:hypothetical protein